MHDLAVALSSVGSNETYLFFGQTGDCRLRLQRKLAPPQMVTVSMTCSNCLGKVSRMLMGC